MIILQKENIKKHNPNWPQIPYHPYRIFKMRGSGNGKAKPVLNVEWYETDVDKINL